MSLPRSIRSALLRLLRAFANRVALIRLARARHALRPRFQHVFEAMERGLPYGERESIEQIESERRRLMSCFDPLVPSGSDEAGPFDRNLTIAEACSVSKPPRPALWLYLLTRELEPRRVLELGTNVGISSAYIAAALRRNGQGGKLTTLDASPHRQRIARELHERLELENVSYVLGHFVETLGPTLHDGAPVDLAFVDGHHQYQPTLDYFDRILGAATPDAVFVFDDVRSSDGMKRAWDALRSDRRVGLSLDLSSVGVCARGGASPWGPERIPRLRIF